MRGIDQCPKCTATSIVLDSRKTAKGIWRRRICHKDECGFRWTTMEIPFRELQAEDKLKQIRAILNA